MIAPYRTSILGALMLAVGACSQNVGPADDSEDAALAPGVRKFPRTGARSSTPR